MSLIRSRCHLLFAGLALVMIVAWAGLSWATTFGRNKVQYRDFAWKVTPTEHFDLYFYDDSEVLAEAVAEIVERVNERLEDVMDHELSTRIPVIIYASHNDFQQTNVTLSHIEEGVGGFTELFKNRVVIPFTGSYDDLRHVIFHELTHVFMFDVVYGGLVESVIRQAYSNPVPLWFVEGLAEYVSQGWDSEADMILEDLTVSDFVIPLQHISGGYLVYKEGQSALGFVAERYGEQKIAEIIRELTGTRNLDRALMRSIGLSTAGLSKEWEAWLKEKYWPRVATKTRADEFAKLVTDHRRQHSYFNIGPAISPDGKKVVFLSDRSGYADVFVASTLDGEVLAKLVSGERSDEFETLHILRTGFSWSPDGENICFAGKSGETDAIHIVDAETGRLVKSLRFKLDAVFTPAWSPEGDRIVFVGVRGGASDLYMTDIDGEELTALTSDYYDEADPAWSPDGRVVAFASDRGTPSEMGFYRGYDLYALDVDTGDIRPLVEGPGSAESPSFSPDGRYVSYVSDRDGSWNLYVTDVGTSESAQLTNLIGGATSTSWALEADWLAFSYYGDAGWDVAVVKEPLTRLEDAIEASGWFPSVEPHLPAEEGELIASASSSAAVEGAAFANRQRSDGDDSQFVPPTSGVAARPRGDRAPRRDDGTSAGREADASSEATGRPPGAEDAADEPAFADRAGEAEGGAEKEKPEDPTVARARDAFRAATGERDSEEEDGGQKPGSVRDYKPKFSPDWVNGGVSYSSGYGLGGTMQMTISDVLGNHRFYISTDFFSSLESSNFYVLYEYLAKRINYSIGVYNFKEYYYADKTRLGELLGERRYFSERNFGASFTASYPFSKFSRVELDVSALSIDRRFAVQEDEGLIEFTDETQKRVLLLPGVRLVNDTTLWGYTGPMSGGRSSLIISKAVDMDRRAFNFLTVMADVRRYVRLGARHSLAVKAVAARSSQEDAQNFFMGGVNTLRGYDDFEFSGTNMALLSIELRQPFIDRLDIASPLPLSLRGLRGVMFLDMGAAWDDDFRGARKNDGYRLQDVKASFGVGVRMIFAFFVIRVDTAWPTDFRETGSAKTHFALGAEF